MTTVLQITDTHIVPDGTLVSGRLDTADSLARLVAHLSAIRDQLGVIDAVLVSGDIADDGHADSYARFKALMAPLKLPLFVVPGNHDTRETMRAAFADHLPPSGPLNWVQKIGDICMIGLDTLVEGHGAGTLSTESLSFLERALQSANKAPVLLALHHPPFQSGIGFMDSIGLTNRQALREIVQVYPGVLRMVCGHIHTMMIADVAGHTVMSAPSPASTIAYDRRADAPVGFLVQEDGGVLHQWNDGFKSVRIAPTIGSGPFPF